MVSYFTKLIRSRDAPFYYVVLLSVLSNVHSSSLFVVRLVCLFLLQEPTNSLPPRLSSGRLQESHLVVGHTGTILCLSQAFPVPSFRWVIGGSSV